MNFLDTSAGRFAYLETGAPDAPLVLCLHGFPDHPPSFVPMMERLSAAGYRCVAPWMRGYVPSVARGPYTPEQLGADAVAMADALSPERPIFVVGHDWGAVAAYMGVMQAPERFRAAVSMAVPHPGPFLLNLKDNPRQVQRSWYMLFFQLPRVPERALRRGNFALIDKLWRDWSPGYRLTVDQRAQLVECLEQSMPAPIMYYRAFFQPVPVAVARVRRLLAAEPIRVPTLHLHGTDDGCIGPELGAGQERFHAGPLAVEQISGTGHFLQLEAPARVADRIASWLGQT